MAHNNNIARLDMGLESDHLYFVLHGVNGIHEYLGISSAVCIRSNEY